MINLLAGIILNTLIHIVDWVSNIISKDIPPQTKGAMVFLIILAAIPLQYAVGLDQYDLNLGDQFLWMVSFELVYMFVDTIRMLLNPVPPDSFSYKVFGFRVSQPIEYTPEQRERHAESALFLRKFGLICIIVCSILLALILPGQILELLR